MKSARSDTVVGVLCGIGAAFSWAAGFVTAKHGVSVGFTPADLAMHRFLWTGLLMLPFMARRGIGTLDGVGWGRGLLITILSGPTQGLLAYTGFSLVPLGHGATIQPACAALGGMLMAAVILHEPIARRRIFGAAIIIAGLLAFGAESITTIGAHGVGGDLLFVTAGLFWASFGTLLRRWSMPGMQAAFVVSTVSALIFGPLYVVLIGFDNVLRLGLAENLLQIGVQGFIAGILPLYLYARSVTLLGAGRAATFPSLVPVFSVVIGFLALGIFPSLPQIAGLVMVVIGFRFALQ